MQGRHKVERARQGGSRGDKERSRTWRAAVMHKDDSPGVPRARQYGNNPFPKGGRLQRYVPR